MVQQTAFYNGYLYQIEYQKHLSNNDYTQHRVYHVKTDDEDYGHAHTAIESIMDDGSWRESEWKMKNKNFIDYLHPYHTFCFDKSLNCFVYIFVRPYDD